MIETCTEVLDGGSSLTYSSVEAYRGVEKAVTKLHIMFWTKATLRDEFLGSRFRRLRATRDARHDGHITMVENFRGFSQ